MANETIQVSGSLVLGSTEIGGRRVVTVILKGQEELPDRSNEQVLINPALVLGAYQDFLTTGTADPDDSMNVSRLEERVAALRDTDCPDYSKIEWDIKNALGTLKKSGRLSSAQANLLPQFTEFLLTRAQDVWTTPTPPRKN